MKDLIERQAAIDAMCELMHHWFGGDPKDEIREIKRELEKLPSAQPKIIYCKDCEHHWTFRPRTFRPMCNIATETCELEQTFYDANVDFCSLAKRRTDEGD